MNENLKKELSSGAFVICAVPIFGNLISGICWPFLFNSEAPNILGVIPFPFYLFFLLPFVLIFILRNDPAVLTFVRVTVCFTTGMVIITPLNLPVIAGFWSLSFWLGSLAYLSLYWKNTNKPSLSDGKYPLWLDAKMTRCIPTDSLDMNVEIIGGTGSGKTRFVIKPFIEQTLEQDLGCFIYDVKSNMVKDIMHYVRGVGRSCDVRYFDIAEPDYSATYNPLYGSDPNVISNRIITALYYDTKKENEYYYNLASAFIHNLTGLLMQDIKTITFMDLYLASSETSSFKIITDYCNKYPNTEYARFFREGWLTKSSRQRQEELTGLVNKLQRFCTRKWSFMINSKKPDITMEQVISENRIFLFGVSASQYPEDAKPLAILAMMDLFGQMQSRFKNNPTKPFRVFLDEFYNLAYPGFIDLINKCREAKMNLFLAHQSLGDLDSVSPSFKEQVMNTAKNKIILEIDDPDTAEHFARMLGTEPDAKARLVSYDSNSNVAGYSIPQMEKFRFHPNLIKELPTGQAIAQIHANKRKVSFQTSLRPATDVPNNFDWTSQINRNHRGERLVETSLNQELPPKEEKKKSVGLMGPLMAGGNCE